MKIKSILTALALLSCASISFAQDCGSSGCNSGGCASGGYVSGYGGGGIYAECVGRRGYPNAFHAARLAQRDKVHPQARYAYSRHGISATHTHMWNHGQMGTYPWHGNYSYHVYNRPTALVVPPTAAFQTVYQWGVGNTQSIPIHHQFGRSYPGTVAGQVGGFHPTPYWPSSTQQFGIYPVRGPW